MSISIHNNLSRFAIVSSLFVVAVLSVNFMPTALAATNINATNRYAWNDTVGWLDFYGTGNVNVTNTQLNGYAVFYGTTNYLALDCNTAPIPSCTTNYYVSNDGAGNLAGWGWNDSYGWFSFCGNASGGSTWNGSTFVCPASPTYQVTLNSSTGVFSGWAWNDSIGWVSLNCANTGASCTPSSYYVQTSWLPSPAGTGNLVSATFDTGYVNGVTYNTIVWLGTLGTGTSSVQFQFGSSNCSNGASNPPTCTSGSTLTGAIDTTNKWAWDDLVGWFNFGPVVVSSTKLTNWGTIQSDGSYVAVDCATTPPGGTNICATSNFAVSDNSNALAGFAWHDTYGWISFCGNSSGGASTWDGTKWVCPGTVTYQVTVDGTGNFHGYAWNDILGWISFNCAEPGVCGTSNYKVQIAGVTGLWNLIGPDGTSASYYQSTGPGVPVPLVGSQHNNKRYFRYKVILNKGLGGGTPTINNVVVNWSP